RHAQGNLSPGDAAIVSACSSGWESDSFFRRLSYSRCISRPAGVVPSSPSRANCRPKPSWHFLSFWRLGSRPAWRNAPWTITAFLPARHSDEDFGKVLPGASRCFPLSCWSCVFRATFELTLWRSPEPRFFGGLLPGVLHFLPCRCAKSLLFAAIGSSLCPGACASGRRRCFSQSCSALPI